MFEAMVAGIRQEVVRRIFLARVRKDQGVERKSVVKNPVGNVGGDVSLKKQLKEVNVNNGQYILSVGQVGDTQPVKNPFISDTQAPVVAKWVADYLVNRKELSGEFRSDPRLDALDRVVVANQFAESVVLITEIKFAFNGAFRGKYAGRAGV